MKGTKKLGVRLGNWLTADQCKNLLKAPDCQTLNGKRDRAILSLLLGCGLRRAEVTKLNIGDLQQREDHWVVVDLIGKGRHIRTVPVPCWVKEALDSWTTAAAVSVCQSCRLDLGQWNHGEGCVAHREKVRQDGWLSTTRTARL